MFKGMEEYFSTSLSGQLIASVVKLSVPVCSIFMNPSYEVHPTKITPVYFHTSQSNSCFSFGTRSLWVRAPAKSLKWKTEVKEWKVDPLNRKSSTLWSEIWAFTGYMMLYDHHVSPLRDWKWRDLELFPLHFALNASGTHRSLSFSSCKY